MKLPEEIKKIIQVLRKLPGVGNKTAERYAFHMLNWEKRELSYFARQIEEMSVKIVNCKECGSIKNLESCTFCDSKRDTELLCIVAHPKDIFSIERTAAYNGLYHVLNNLLSPMDGQSINPDEIEKIKNRIIKNGVKELLIAIDSTIEGDATSLYLRQQLSSDCNKISRLAFGVPLNSSLEYIDEGTLARSLLGRQLF